MVRAGQCQQDILSGLGALACTRVCRAEGGVGSA